MRAKGNLTMKPLEIPLTGKRANGQVMLVDAGFADTILPHKWHLSSWGYAAHRNPSGKYILAHRRVMSAPDGIYVDHINGNKLDNRLENLRLATAEQNGRNCKTHSRNTSGFRGVYWSNTCKYWYAQIFDKGENIHLGTFGHLADAIGARVGAEVLIYGEFARRHI